MTARVAKQEIKTIHGRDYLYLTYYDGATKKKKTVYCGPKADIDSKKKAIRKEIELMSGKIADLQDRKRDLRARLGELRRVRSRKL